MDRKKLSKSFFWKTVTFCASHSSNKYEHETVRNPQGDFGKNHPFAGQIVNIYEVILIEGCCLIFGIAHNSFCAYVAFGEIAVAKLADRNPFGRGWMCKASIPNIDTNMGNAAASRIEKYQISCAKLAFGDGSASSELGIGLARNGNAHFFQYILRKSGTIKSFSGWSASFVWNADGLMNNAV